MEGITCRCGQPLQTYAFDVRDGGYDAWLFQDTPTEINLAEAASRADVLSWLTNFRPPAHDVTNGEYVMQAGQCQAVAPHA